MLILLALKRGGYHVSHSLTCTPAGMRAELSRQVWDVITSDHSMPGFSAPAALALAREMCPYTPFIIVSGEIDLNLAVLLMREGAQDYVQKRELPRLAATIEHALSEAAVRVERKQAIAAMEASEARYRRLFETARDGVLILDVSTGQIDDVNPYLIEMLGFSKEALLGKKLWEIGVFSDTTLSKLAFEELQAHGYVRYDDLPLQTIDRQLKSVEFISNVYTVHGLKVAQCNIRDITQRKFAEAKIHELNAELEQRVQDRTAQLEALNQDLEAFSASVSHDLRAPVRRILGFADLLRDTSSDQNATESLDLIRSIRISAERMTLLIDALLKLARFSQVRLIREPVDLSAVARRIAGELRQTDPQRDVEFIIAQGVMADGDESLLWIVIENLMANAWKFTSRTPRARIEFGADASTGPAPAWCVRDNGAGFDMQHAERMFLAFQRLPGVSQQTNDAPDDGHGVWQPIGLAHQAAALRVFGMKQGARGAGVFRFAAQQAAAARRTDPVQAELERRRAAVECENVGDAWGMAGGFQEGFRWCCSGVPEPM